MTQEEFLRGIMQTSMPLLVRNLYLASLSIFCVFSTLSTAQEEIDQFNTVLDIEELYSEIISQAVHGETAADLLEE